MGGPYTLSGSGVQAIDACGALHIHIDTPAAGAGAGRAYPATYFGVGFVKLGTSYAYFNDTPISSDDQVIPCPNGTTRFGYALLGGAVVTVTEVAGASPWQGPPGDPGATGATGPAGPAGAAGSDVSALIASEVLTSSAATIDFVGIPQTYRHLRLLIISRLDTGTNNTFNTGLRMNGDSTAGDYASSLAPSNGAGIGFLENSGALNGWSLAEIVIPDYVSSSRVKSVVGYEDNNAGTLGQFPKAVGGVWLSTSAINRLTIIAGSGNFLSGSGAWLYGSQG